MTGMVAVLSVSIGENWPLTEIFGGEAARQGLADFGEAVDGLMTRLLIQHDVTDRYRSDADGSWSACFRVLSGGLPRDARETAEAIEDAGRKLVRELLLAVFGGATGARMPASVGVFLQPPEAAAPDARASWIHWAEEKLRSQPQSPSRSLAVRPAEVTAILAERSIRTLLQPIVRMRDGKVIGFEALSRGPQGTPCERPDILFDAAHAAGRLVEMELLCAELALERTAEKLPPDTFLAINLGPAALALAADRLPLAGRKNIMFELTEHLPLDEAEGLVGAVDRLRAMGIRLALDDIGCGFADVGTVRVLRPDIVKLCITVIRNADKGQSFLAAIRTSAEQLRELGCQVLAEGVETATQHAALTDCGIELAQGWLFGKPEAIGSGRH